MDLSKHVIINNNRNPLHSNEFAVIANGSHFGATSDVTFGQRKKIDQNRQTVGIYHRSSIGNSYGDNRAMTVDSNIDRRTRTLSKSQMQQLRQSGILSKSQMRQFQNTQQRSNNFIVPSSQFQEPIPRPYNPYH